MSICDERQRLILNLDQFQSIISLVQCFGNDHCNPIANIAYAALCKDRLRSCRRAGTADVLRHKWRPQSAQAFSDSIDTSEHAEDARRGKRGGNIDVMQEGVWVSRIKYNGVGLI
jgi:hypothetical protein